MSTININSLSPYWWYRGKDQAGANGSTVTSIPDVSGNSRPPTSVGTGITVSTSGVTATGKAIQCQGTIFLPDLNTALTAPSSGLTGKVVVSQMFNASYNGDELVNANIGTQWGWASGSAPSVGAPQWARFGPFSPGRVITSYQIRGTGNTARAPKDWIWQGSNSTSGPWVDLDIRNGVTSLTGTVWQNFEYSNSTPYAYYRLYVTATTSNDMVHIDEMMLDGIPNGGVKGGEFWVVYRMISSNGSAWRFGMSAQQNHWHFGGSVYSDFGESTRRQYTPSLALTSWRAIRLRSSITNGRQEWIDNTIQLSVAGTTPAWLTTPSLWGSGGPVQIAEAFFLPEITDAQAAAVYDYLNLEHGLLVPGSVPLDAPSIKPSDVSNLRYWLRGKDLGAADSSVTSWADQSGNNNHGVPPSTAPVVKVATTPTGGKSVLFSGQAMNLTKSLLSKFNVASATVTSTPAGAGFSGAQTFDGDKTTRWLGSDPSIGTPQILTHTLSTSGVAKYYYLSGHDTSTTYNPRSWTFEGSNNGTTWDVLDTQSNVSWSSASEMKQFAIANTTSYLHYRLKITDNVSATDYVAVGELIISELALPEKAELWMVVKASSATANTQAWQFGASGQPTIYPWSNGQVVDNFMSNSHSSLFTPTVDVSAWRLYRVRYDAGTMTIWIDNVQQKVATGLSWAPRAIPQLSSGFSGNQAESFAFVNSLPTNEQVAALTNYINREHGLSAIGGAAPSQSPSMAFWGLLQSFS